MDGQNLGTSTATAFSEMLMEQQQAEEDVADCTVEIFADRRWYLVAVAGTSLSAISLVCNVLIACVLLRPRNSNFFFLGLLALSDAFLSACYGPVIAMDIIKNRVQLLWLTRLWWSYVGPLLTLCHVSMTFSCFMIILGTIERFLITLKSPMLSCFRTNRGPFALGMFFVSLVLRGTAIFEVEIVRNGNCTGLAEYEPNLTSLTQSWNTYPYHHHPIDCFLHTNISTHFPHFSHHLHFATFTSASPSLTKFHVLFIVQPQSPQFLATTISRCT